MMRHGLLIVLAAFLFLGGDVSGPTRLDRCAGRSRLCWPRSLWFFSGVRATWPQAPKAHGRRPSTWRTCWARASGSAACRRSRSFCTAPAGTPPLPIPTRCGPCSAFPRVALITVLILAGSGVASAWLLVGGVAGLVGTTHGCLLLAKLAVLVLALLLAAASRAMLPALVEPDRGKLVRGGAAHGAVHRDRGGSGADRARLRHGDDGDHARDSRRPGMALAGARLSLDALSEVPILAASRAAPIAFMLGASGLTILAVVFLVRRRPILLFGTLFALDLQAAPRSALQPSMALEAYPTSFARPPVPYSAASIAEGMAVHQAHCASCHGTPTPDRAAPRGSSVDLLARRRRRGDPRETSSG